MPNVGEQLNQFKNGVLFTGLLIGGAKALETSSPFVKKAFDNMSDNMKAAKIALKNMQRRPKTVTLGMNGGNADEALREFANKFKKAKRLVKPNSKNPMFGDDWNDYFSKKYGKENVDWLTDTSKRAKVNYGDHFEKVNGKKVLKPNIEYVAPEGYKYTTDSDRVIETVEANLQLGKGKRSPYSQRTVGGKDRLQDDAGGHLIGSQFKGSGGIWYTMESEWARALLPDKLGNKSIVDVSIKVYHTPGNIRPKSFIVKYKIDGAETIVEILNKIGG